MTTSKGGRETKERRSFAVVGGMCPRCEGRGSINDIDRTALYDASRSINDGALSIPGWSMDGWQGRILRGVGPVSPSLLRRASAEGRRAT